MSYKASLSIINLRDKEITFHLEPWGEQIPMPCGATFQVVAEAKKHGGVEIEYEEDHLIVWGWETSVLNVYCNGMEVSTNHPEVPLVPKGTTVSSFSRSLFGKNE